jgi:formylglycine-generating enzyme required for sulfatase activity
MIGNVWEWCSDRYGPYAPDSQADPLGPAKGAFRVNRGGCWYGASYTACPFRTARFQGPTRTTTRSMKVPSAS